MELDLTLFQCIYLSRGSIMLREMNVLLFEKLIPLWTNFVSVIKCRLNRKITNPRTSKIVPVDSSYRSTLIMVEF